MDSCSSVSFVITDCTIVACQSVDTEGGSRSGPKPASKRVVCPLGEIKAFTYPETASPLRPELFPLPPPSEFGAGFEPRRRSRWRTRLFDEIEFGAERVLELWKKTFPDPATSPARYTKTLYVDCPQAVVAADAEAGGWLKGFSRVARLELDAVRATHHTLIPFHGLSPVIKSLRVGFVALPPSRILNLILSFPALEDLTLVCGGAPIDSDDGPDEPPTAIQPSNPPTLTGSLELPIHHPSLVVPSWRRPLPEPHFEVPSQGRFSAGDCIGGAVFVYP